MLGITVFKKARRFYVFTLFFVGIFIVISTIFGIDILPEVKSTDNIDKYVGCYSWHGVPVTSISRSSMRFQGGNTAFSVTSDKNGISILPSIRIVAILLDSKIELKKIDGNPLLMPLRNKNSVEVNLIDGNVLYLRRADNSLCSF